jgi:hypothetical protein
MHCDVAVRTRDNDKVERGPEKVAKRPRVDPENGRWGAAISRLQVTHKFVGNREVNFASVIKADQDAAVRIEDVDSGHEDGSAIEKRWRLGFRVWTGRLEVDNRSGLLKSPLFF